MASTEQPVEDNQAQARILQLEQLIAAKEQEMADLKLLIAEDLLEIGILCAKLNKRNPPTNRANS